MAYTPNTLVMRAMGFVEGGFNVWEYTSADSLSLVLGPGYFTDGASKGMKVGDIVWVVNQAAVSATQCQCSASTVTTSGGLTQSVGSSTIVASTALDTANNPRNLLDGGDATVNPWQRGTSFSGIVATNTYTADRWFMVAGAASSANMVKTADTSIPTFSQAFVWGRASGAASVSAIVLGQVLESLDSIRLQSAPLTLSFWAKSMSGYTGGALAVRVGQGTGTDQSASSFANQTWSNYSDAISTTQVLTAAYQRYAFIGSAASNATQLGVSFAFTPVGTNTGNDAVSMIGVQLEQGGMSLFEHRDVQFELELCQRYFFQVNETSTAIIAPGAVEAANTTTFICSLPVQMRVAPAVTVVAGSFAQQVSGTTVAVSGFAAGATHTPNFVTVTSTATATAGLAALLVSRSTNSGSIAVSADL